MLASRPCRTLAQSAVARDSGETVCSGQAAIWLRRCTAYSFALSIGALGENFGRCAHLLPRIVMLLTQGTQTALGTETKSRTGKLALVLTQIVTVTIGFLHREVTAA